MTAAVTNPYTLTWGSFSVGGTTERLIVGLHRIVDTFEEFSVTLDVLVRGTSDATFATNCAEMHTEFSKRRQLILWKVGTETIHTFNPASGTNTGLNTYARIEKVGTPGADTDRSRLYTITVGCGKPASDTSGRRDSTVVVEYDPAQRRTITISGVWTALTTNRATAQYAASIDAYTTSVLDALLPSLASTARELIGQRTEADDQDQVIRWSRTFREILVGQPSATLNHASIVDPTWTLTRSTSQPGDSGGGNVKRLEDIRASFSCWVDKTVTTDIEALYTGTILPFLKAQLVAEFAPTQWAIPDESHDLVPYTNQLVCNVTFRCAINPTDVIESAATARIVENSGVVLTGAWTGQLFAKYVDQGIATRRRFGIRAVRVLGTVQPNERVGGGGSVFGAVFSGGGEQYGQGNPNGAAGFNPGGGIGGLQPEGGGGGGSSGWILIDNDSAATPKWIGKPGEEQIAVTDLVEQTVEEWVERPSRGGGGGGLRPGPGGSVVGIGS